MVASNSLYFELNTHSINITFQFYSGKKNNKKKRKCVLEYNSAGHLLNFNNLVNCKNAKCACDEYKCETDGYCIPLNKVCDGLSHCPQSDDEQGCGKSYKKF